MRNPQKRSASGKRSVNPDQSVEKSKLSQDDCVDVLITAARASSLMHGMSIEHILMRAATKILKEKKATLEEAKNVLNVAWGGFSLHGGLVH